jgi:hypothetical protein
MPSFSARAGLVFGAVIVIAVIVASALYAGRLRADRDRRLAVARAEVGRLESAQRAIDANGKRVDTEFSALDQAERDATRASSRRHDEAVNGDPSTSSNLALAKREAKDVDEAESHLEAIGDGLDYFATVSASVLGDDAVRQYRSDVQAWMTSEKLYFTNWSRAVGDIVDSDKLELRGELSSSSRADVEHLYSASEEAGTRADVQDRALVVDAKQIRARIRARIVEAKAKLANI